jgi:hypothetical protein
MKVNLMEQTIYFLQDIQNILITISENKNASLKNYTVKHQLALFKKYH